MKTDQKSRMFFMAIEQAIQATAQLDNASDVEGLLRQLRPNNRDAQHDALVKGLTETFCDGDKASGAKLAAAVQILNHMEPHVLVAWMLANAGAITKENPYVVEDDMCSHWASILGENIQTIVDDEPTMMNTQVGEA